MRYYTKAWYYQVCQLSQREGEELNRIMLEVRNRYPSASGEEIMNMVCEIHGRNPSANHFELEAEKMVQEMDSRYHSATQHMHDLFSEDLRRALTVYDSTLTSQYWDGDKYVLEFEPHGMSSTKKLVFSGIDELRGDESLTGFTAAHVEQYAYDDKYEVHMLFDDFTEDDELIAKELIISAKKIEYELAFRNVGKEPKEPIGTVVLV